jgi:hypothetical protein
MNGVIFWLTILGGNTTLWPTRSRRYGCDPTGAPVDLSMRSHLARIMASIAALI